LKVELGCGSSKREGFYGIDIQGEQADLILNIETTELPFDDNSIEYVYCSHVFEHLKEYPFVLREILRVCSPEAVVEIWTPYGKSNDGLLFGHFNFLTETHFKHICYEYDRFYLGNSNGYFDWYETHYVLYPGIREQLESMDIPLEFAMEHMYNIALEWGVFLKVKKNESTKIPQIPCRKYFYGRGNEIKLTENL